MARFCTECGAPLREDSLFCEECGARVSPAPAPEPPAEKQGGGYVFVSAPEEEAKEQDTGYVRVPAPEPKAYVIPPATDNNSVFTGFTPSYGNVIAFEKTKTMCDAAELAVSRNEGGKWSYWDSPGKYRNAARDLRRFAEKEDKRLSRFSDRGGILYYVVSPAGSVGQVLTDETEIERPVLEWAFFAPGEDENTLPKSPEEI